MDRLAVTTGAAPTREAEAEAFARHFEEHTPALFNYCLYRVGDPAVAEDLTADIFERAWRARRRYSPERAGFSTWLFAISRRRVLNWQRRQARRRTVDLDESLASPRPGPLAAALRAEERSHLLRLVGKLPAETQELVALKFGAGLTNRRIAEVVGKSETAVGSALYRAVQKLRRTVRILEGWKAGRLGPEAPSSSNLPTFHPSTLPPFHSSTPHLSLRPTCAIIAHDAR